MSAPTVLLDACTLVPIRLTSCLLSLAEAGLFVPLWSEEILEEVERNLPRLKGMDSEKARRRVVAIREAFGDEAAVEGYEDMVPRLSCHPKDRHVLLRPSSAVRTSWRPSTSRTFHSSPWSHMVSWRCIRTAS